MPAKSNLQDPDLAAPVPLVVDLDSTLCRSDTLHEALIRLALHRPLRLVPVLLALRRGRVAFKTAVADQMVVPPSALPYDPNALDLIAQTRALGGQVWLVSAADARQVGAVADHLGLFDGWQGSEPGSQTNLKAEAKAAALVARFGAGGFDYLGDSAADLPVWQQARRALLIRPAPKLEAATRLEVIGPAAPTQRHSLLRAMRPHQWLKNLLLLVPALAALDLAALPAALAAMLCFSLAASGVYLVNDLADLDSDRRHPRKRNRPFAAGTAPLLAGLALAPLLFGLAIGAALALLPLRFLGGLLLYIMATFAYSLWIKRKMMADIVGLAGLYTLRVWAGALATGIALSPWLLVFSMFLFFSLAAMKRQAELEDLSRNGDTRAAGRNLDVADLQVIQGMAVTSAQAAALVFALYALDPAVRAHHAHPVILLMICPILMFWLGRLQLLTRRGHMTDDPVVFTLRDRVSLACAAMIAALFGLSGALT